MKPKKLVYGLGVNDADYPTQYIDIRTTNRAICPYFRTWKSIIQRVAKPSAIHKDIVYTIHPEWISFMSFKKWMKQQDRVGKVLSRIILDPDNTTFGPDTCRYISKELHGLISKKSTPDHLPRGVTIRHTAKGVIRYIAKCSDPRDHTIKYLGSYDDPTKAHVAYIAFKQSLIRYYITPDLPSDILQGLQLHQERLTMNSLPTSTVS